MGDFKTLCCYAWIPWGLKIHTETYFHLLRDTLPSWCYVIFMISFLNVNVWGQAINQLSRRDSAKCFGYDPRQTWSLEPHPHSNLFVWCHLCQEWPKKHWVCPSVCIETLSTKPTHSNLPVTKKNHGVWKSKKKSRSTLRAKRAKYVYILSEQKFIKNAKNSTFEKFIENQCDILPEACSQTVLPHFL